MVVVLNQNCIYAQHFFGLKNYNKLYYLTTKGMNVKMKETIHRIIIDPQIHFGKPCIAGTRIPVENVLELLQEGITFNEIIEQYYPELEIEDIKACLHYATELVKRETIIE